jgi:NAD(P)-dependent dehydrogenase (short-subunit alcohol dehydrogenase family)
MDEAHALVVGASSEIGRAVAGELAGLGMSVTLWGRAPGRLEAAADVCAQSGQRAFADCVDVTDAADVSQTVTALSGRGPLSVVAYAAGEFDWAPADRADRRPGSASSTST